MNGKDSKQQNGFHATSAEVPVLIIGGGPTGLFQAYLLSRLGVKSMIVERYLERLGAPKAHALSPRTLEICRQFGLDVRRIRSLGSQRGDAYWVNFVTDLSGERVGVLPYERMDVDVLKDTPEMIHNIPQPVFEQFVTDNLFMDRNVDIRKGVTFVSVDQAGGDVVTTVEERATSTRYTIRSRYLIACDGARSKVREYLGISSEGEDSYETQMTIHFKANLRPLVGKRVGMLHWIMDPMVSGFIIAYDLSGNAVLISNFDADTHPVEAWNDEQCRKLLYRAFGQKIPLEILSFRPWILSRKVATSYRVGNIFLAGDAAHSFPPTGGLGLNCGLADVHNLAYKIAAVHKGWANNSLLDTYQSDRRRVAEINSKQSVKNGKEIFRLLKLLGTAGIHDPEEARRSLYQTIQDPEKIKEVAEGIEGQREHFDNLELHIGYVYGSLKDPPHASKYSPKYIPGARLPHAWITPIPTEKLQHLPPVDLSYVHELSETEIKARHFSTLDLCTPDAFTIITGDPEIWRERLSVLSLKHILKRGLKFNWVILGKDFNLIESDAGNLDQWRKGAGLLDGGGLLVRPDQHILMRLEDSTTTGDILDALKGHIGPLGLVETTA